MTGRDHPYLVSIMLFYRYPIMYHLHCISHLGRFGFAVLALAIGSFFTYL